MMTDLDVSVIIVNWNTCDILRDCLRSVFEQTHDIAFEVIVVDNASSDGSVEMVKAEFAEVILVENEDNRGFAAANNQGMEIARGRFVLLLNSDTVVLDQAIQKTLAFAQQRSEAAVVGCRVLNADRTLQPTCFMYPSLLNMLLASTYLYKLFPQSRFFGRERLTWWRRNDERDVQVVTGCFMLVRNEAIDQVGMMDDGYFMYGEETDWCYRFAQAGWRNIFYPDAEIVHLGGQSSKRVKVRSIVQLRLSILRYFKKNKSWPYYFCACILMVLFFVLRIPGWGLKYLLNTSEREISYGKLQAYALGTKAVLRNMFCCGREEFTL